MEGILKIKNDKYYTSDELAKYCIDKTFKIIGRENITEIIEPSAGNGSFSKQINNCIAYDIEPESKDILKLDYLSLDLEYKKGRLIIGNPPFGSRNILAVKFFKKSIQLCDYIAFILPISQLNNNQQMYEFDLIYSKAIDNKGVADLDKRTKLVFNIYKKSSNGFNKKPNYKLKDIEIKEYRINKKLITKKEFDYDIRIVAWGWKIGKEVEYECQYAKEFCIKIYNEKYRKEIIELIKNTRWQSIYPMTANENLCQWQVLKYIKEQIPELS